MKKEDFDKLWQPVSPDDIFKALEVLRKLEENCELVLFEDIDWNDSHIEAKNALEKARWALAQYGSRYQ